MLLRTINAWKTKNVGISLMIGVCSTTQDVGITNTVIIIMNVQLRTRLNKDVPRKLLLVK